MFENIFSSKRSISIICLRIGMYNVYGIHRMCVVLIYLTDDKFSL